jgi:hypothetical protein
MASPLAPYINSLVVFKAEGTVGIVNGRYVATDAGQYVVKAFMKRAQYSGVSSGSRKLPLESQLDGTMMPGASGDAFYYRGYALEWTYLPGGGFDIENPDISGYTFATVARQYDWMYTGQEVDFLFGEEKPLIGVVQRSSGIFGGLGIDEIVYKEIGGVELQIIGGEIQV